MLLDDKLLDGVTQAAKESPRRRMNLNLHERLDAKAQRLFNALEPGTELPVHRHRHTAETYILVRGRLDVIFYDDNRNETARYALDPHAGRYGVHIPAGQWHTLEVHESGTVIFEVKDGPYTPLAPEDEEVVAVVDVDLRRSEQVRRWWPFLRDRRIEEFGPLTRRFLDEE